MRIIEKNKFNELSEFNAKDYKEELQRMRASNEKTTKTLQQYQTQLFEAQNHIVYLETKVNNNPSSQRSSPDEETINRLQEYETQLCEAQNHIVYLEAQINRPSSQRSSPDEETRNKLQECQTQLCEAQNHIVFLETQIQTGNQPT